MTIIPSVEDWNFSQNFLDEDASILKAREKAKELNIQAIGSEIGRAHV